MAVKKFDATDEDLSYMQYVAQQPSEKKDVSFIQSLTNAPYRALIKGAVKAGQSFGPLGTKREVEEKNKELSNLLDEYLPQGDQFIPKAIERGGQAAIETLAFPEAAPSMVSRAALGGGLAEGAKELGASDIAQTGIEVGTQLIPDLSKSIPNRLPTKAAQTEKKLIEDARRLGLTEEELALTLDQRGPFKDFVQEISSKGGRTVQRFDNTRRALGNVWNNLRGSKEAQKAMTPEQSSELVTNLSKRVSKLPSEQADRIMKDYNKLLSSPMRGEDIIEFWQNLNYYIAKGERGLGVLKEDLQKGLIKLSPELGKDFEITNKLYGNFHKLAERMGPTVAESLIKAGENGILLSAVTTGNYPLLNKVLGPVLARQLATEMSTNPRLMNLSSRFINSFERGMPQIAKKVYEQILLEVGKINGEAAMKMSEMDFDKLFEVLDEEDKLIKSEAEKIYKNKTQDVKYS